MSRGVIQITAALSVFLLFGFEVWAQQRIASVQNFIGEMEIVHSAQIIKPIKIGKIIRNGDIFDQDTARTGQGEAELLIVDGSLVRMDRNTTLLLAFETSAPTTPGAPPAVDRKMRIVVGRIWCDIKPSRTSATKFELPDGVAAVRGTKTEFYVSGTGAWEATAETGVMTLTHTGVNAQMTLSDGNKIGAVQQENGVQFSNLGTGLIDMLLGDGSRITDFDPTDIIRVRLMEDGTYEVSAVFGSFTFTNAAGQKFTVGQGQSCTSAGVITGVAPGGLGPGPIPPSRTGGGGGGGMSPSEEQFPFEHEP